MQIYQFALLILYISIISIGHCDDLDNSLIELINKKEIEPLYPEPFELNPKYVLGQALFFDPILSGNRDVSCSTCHLFSRGATDRLKTSIGVNGTNLGEMRTLIKGELEHPRNALDIWNRDEDSVKTLFWDGQFEVLDPVSRIFRSPLGKNLPKGFENLLAVQAVFPLVVDNEMLGRYGDRSGKELPNGHENQVNELALNDGSYDEIASITRTHQLIIERLLGRNKAIPLDWQITYRALFYNAYPDKNIDDFTIVEVGNAVAHFEELAFATRNVKWDRYILGKKDTLTKEAKIGALIFFGRGQCDNCHNGALFSDFAFHSIGVKQIRPGINSSGLDYGRYNITGNIKDKYKFRTPPLRNATLTAPYFHDGVVSSLREAIIYHLQPNDMKNDEEMKKSISALLPAKEVVSDEDVYYLIEFIKHLEDDQEYNRDLIIPKSVPSGLPLSIITR